jgi:hypothetical protein
MPDAGEPFALILEEVHSGGGLYSQTLHGRVAARAGRLARHNARPMPIPKNVTFVTFDVYGTLIDWDSGAFDAFTREAGRDGFEMDRDTLIPLFHSIQQQIQAGSYELYAEVLRRTAVQIAEEIGWPLEPSRSGFLPDSVQRWPAFREPNPGLQRRSSRISPRSRTRRQAAHHAPSSRTISTSS